MIEIMGAIRSCGKRRENPKRARGNGYGRRRVLTGSRLDSESRAISAT